MELLSRLKELREIHGDLMQETHTSYDDRVLERENFEASEKAESLKVSFDNKLNSMIDELELSDPF